MSETKWVDWHPKPGDKSPSTYQWRPKTGGPWRCASGVLEMSNATVECYDYQIPAPEETAMKYWQPRVEPMQRGWTLADVPDDVLCEVEVDGTDRHYMRRIGSAVKINCSPRYKEACIDPRDCRVIRVIDPIPPGALTLDKVPDNVKCVLNMNGHLVVGYRIGDVTYGCNSGEMRAWSPIQCNVTHILDPLPEATVTLDTLPVGRVIEKCGMRYWKTECGAWFGVTSLGTIGESTRNATAMEPFTVTDYIMELKEVEHA